MGEVWSARNERTNRDFAIKFLLPALARHPEALQRFVREAKATGQLRHPNVVSVLDAGMHDRRPYLVMELLTGESLDECLKRVGKLKPVHACVIMAQVARAVAYAHQMKVVHRDLSSSNVYLNQMNEGEPPVVKVLDFGVSKVLTPENALIRTSNGAVLGSPAYMSPEQACGADRVDERTDVWALGVLLYQCLSGKLPFMASNYNALMFAIASTPHESLVNQLPQLDPELAQLVEACLVKDREHRLESAQAVFERLERVALQLSKRSPSIGFHAGRRATDRLRPPPNRRQSWFGTAPVPLRVMPLGVRLGLLAKQGRGSIGALIGLSMGLAISHFSYSALHAEPDGIKATPAAAQSAQCAPKSKLPEPSVGLAQNNIAPVSETPNAAAAAKETDLVRAVARGLSRSDPAPQTGHNWPEHSH